MRSLLSRSLVVSAIVLSTLLLAFPAFGTCQGGQGEKVAVVKVTIRGQGHAITVDKQKVEIGLKRGRVCWDITGMEAGQTLTMRGKTPSDNQFPELHAKAPKSTINSGAATKAGTFTYGLYLTDSEGNQLSELDPQVIIDPSG